MTSIGDSAFAYCNELTNITIQESVTRVGNNAFLDCTALPNIFIPTSIISMGADTFKGCKNLTISCKGTSKPDGWDVKWNPNDCPVIYEIDDVGKTAYDLLYSIKANNEIIITGYVGNANIIVIPSNIDGRVVTGIVSEAFKNKIDVINIFIPKSVINIGLNAFIGCVRMTISCESTSKPMGWVDGWNPSNRPTIQGSKGVDEYRGIYYSINADNKIIVTGCGLSYIGIEIPSTIDGISVTGIVEEAFKNHSELVNVIIPTSITFVGKNAFSDCPNLTVSCMAESKPLGWDFNWNSSNCPVIWESNGIMYTSDGLGYIINSDNEIIIIKFRNTVETVVIPPEIEGKPVIGIAQSAFKGSGNLKSVIIPDSVRSIGDSAFENCWRLTNVTIGNGVTSIGNKTFYQCSKLTSVIIPDSVTSIGERAFQECTELSSVIIPDSVRSIGDSAFLFCKGLTSVTIGNGVTSIGEHAFNYCVMLTNLIIGNSVTSIGKSAFQSCASLTRVTIPGSVTSMGMYMFNNGGLTNVIIEDGVTSIGTYTFYDCKGLTSVIIPDSVTSIGEDAFSYCIDLPSIFIPSSVTSIGKDAFDECHGLIINCEADSKPCGWVVGWDFFNCKVKWGVPRKN